MIKLFKNAKRIRCIVAAINATKAPGVLLNSNLTGKVGKSIGIIAVEIG
jgi:hypothetical protein